jgi:anti-sigma factor RsiW
MNKKLNEHEQAREWMPLAAASALDDGQERQLSAHLASCSECAAEFEGWRDLGAAMRRIPTPQAPVALVQRVRVNLVAYAMQQAERRTNWRVMAWLILFAWTATLATWPVMKFVSQGAASWLDLSFVHTMHLLIGYTIVSWLCAAAAAAVLGLRHRQDRRMA